jgi:hypothetical protein
MTDAENIYKAFGIRVEKGKSWDRKVGDKVERVARGVGYGGAKAVEQAGKVAELPINTVMRTGRGLYQGVQDAKKPKQQKPEGTAGAAAAAMNRPPSTKGTAGAASARMKPPQDVKNMQKAVISLQKFLDNACGCDEEILEMEKGVGDIARKVGEGAKRMLRRPTMPRSSVTNILEARQQHKDGKFVVPTKEGAGLGTRESLEDVKNMQKAMIFLQKFLDNDCGCEEDTLMQHSKGNPGPGKLGRPAYKDRQDKAERRQGGAYANKERDSEHRTEYPVGDTSEGGYLGGFGTAEDNYKWEMTGLRREGRGGSEYVEGGKKRTAIPPSKSMRRGVLADSKRTAKRKQDEANELPW